MKTALCVATCDFLLGFKTSADIPKDTLIISGNIPRIYNLKTILAARYNQDGSPLCEVNPELLQVLPYITVYRKNVEGVKEYFMYTRGELSTEGRLTGKCSLGLGGHIEEDGFYLKNIIMEGARRELEEEIGYKNIPNIHLEEALNNGFLFFLNNHGVESYHLGVSITLEVRNEDIGSTEEGIITKGRWVTLEEITNLVSTNQVELEQWSKFVLSLLNDGCYVDTTKVIDIQTK